MASIIDEINGNMEEEYDGDNDALAGVNRWECMDVDEEDSSSRIEGGVENLGTSSSVLRAESELISMEVQGLLQEQCHAYDIIDWHLDEMLKGNKPQQLLMMIPGEGGVGKLKTIMENFIQQGAAQLLAKSAYTGIAASIINGKMLHVICQIPINGCNWSQKSNKKLIQFWQHKLYLIIDEKLMLSRKFFACISSSICSAKALVGCLGSDLPFGSVNIILIDDFHQFPLVIR